MAAPIAIMLFGGLRPSELTDLTPSDIREKHLVISGGKMEGKIKRRVPIVPVLEQWLSAYPFNEVPQNWYKKMEALKAAVQPERWVSDILRHTSISYQIEKDDDIGKVATRNGASDKMITLHYRDVVENPNDVTAFWGLTPDVVEGVALDGELPAGHSVSWPDDELLRKLVWEKPLSQQAKDFGVSDNAIRKRGIGRLGGHFVTGHVDTSAQIAVIEPRGANTYRQVQVPEPFRQYVVYKGCMAIDGMSLTIAEAGPDTISVCIIPHTLEVINLSQRKAGDVVNLEFDLLAKYVERMMAGR